MTKPKSRSRSRIRRWLENLLLFAAVVGLSAWAGANALPLIWQDWENWVFDQELRGEPAAIARYAASKRDLVERNLRAYFGLPNVPDLISSPPQVAKSPHKAGRAIRTVRDNELLGRLAIPRLGLSAIVREGTGEGTLGFAVGHIPGTAIPGQRGNVAVAGHRDTLFFGLKKIQKNDLIRFETFDGEYLYEVGSTQIVKPRNVSVLQPGRESELTLVTCYPFNYIGSAPDRFIVKARQVSWTARRPDDLVPAPQEPAVERVVSAAGNPPARPTPARPNPARETPARGRVPFSIARNHSQTLAPGISLGVDDTDETLQSVSGWMWIMPDRRTIWLRRQHAQDPLVFYGEEDGKRRELLITNVTASAATGYLVLAP
jgi:LPXTG-site transpeptidase (sortase) family protein